MLFRSSQTVVVAEASTAVVAAQAVVDSATVAVNTQQIVVDSATATVASAQESVTVATTAVDSQTITVTTDTAAVQTAQDVVNSSTTPGLKETIYQDTGYNNAPPVGAGVIKVVTTDTNGINENWGSGSPAAGVNADDFQIHWEGQITSDTTQNIRFYAPSDDGIKV